MSFLSKEEQTRFNYYYEELQRLDKNKLITAVRIGRILEGIKSTLTEPSNWDEFIHSGLPTHINNEQASCFINLTKFYDSFNSHFKDEFNCLSIKALLYLNHPVMPLKIKLSMLSAAKEINSKHKDVLDLNLSSLEIKEVEVVIGVYLKVILFERGIIFEDIFRALD